MSDILYEIVELEKYFPVRKGILLRTIGQIRAVDGVSFYIKEGETLGLAGESGCGKTTIGRCLILVTPITAGKLLYLGQDLLELGKGKIQKIRCQMAMIFQDSYSSLNPMMTVADIVGEPLEVNNIAKGSKKEKMVIDLLETVGLSPYHIYRYPHEFSGGQKQRIGIARALAAKPKFIIADEPVASLDISVRATILNLMSDLQKDFKLTYLFISHDLSVLKHICDRVMIMYLGKIVEIAETEELYRSPEHPYTKALMSAIPIPDPTIEREQIILTGDVPTPINLPTGCRFHPRCIQAKPICSQEEPELIEKRPSHFVACHF